MTEFKKDNLDVANSNPKLIEDLKRQAAHTLNKIRNAEMPLSEDNSEDILKGTLYSVNDEEVLVVPDRGLFLISSDGVCPLDSEENEGYFGDALGQVLVDTAIIASRRELARILSAGDTNFNVVLDNHLSFNDGKIEPVMKEGIEFYSVHEASGIRIHMGVKDGKSYFLCEKVSHPFDQNEIGEYEIIDKDGIFSDEAAA